MNDLSLGNGFAIPENVFVRSLNHFFYNLVRRLMGIDFGILRDGSTITLVGEYRVSLDENTFDELQPLFERIQSRTGMEMDLYGAASFDGKALSMVVAEIQATLKEPNAISQSGHAFLKELLRIACIAEASGKTLSYFGL